MKSRLLGRNEGPAAWPWLCIAALLTLLGLVWAVADVQAGPLGMVIGTGLMALGMVATRREAGDMGEDRDDTPPALRGEIERFSVDDVADTRAEDAAEHPGLTGCLDPDPGGTFSESIKPIIERVNARQERVLEALRAYHAGADLGELKALLVEMWGEAAERKQIEPRSSVPAVNMAEVERLCALAEEHGAKATPGPWLPTPGHQGRFYISAPSMRVYYCEREQDAMFIGNARHALPALAKETRSLLAENERLRAEVARLLDLVEDQRCDANEEIERLRVSREKDPVFAKEEDAETTPLAEVERRYVVTDGGIGALARRHGIDLVVVPETLSAPGKDHDPLFAKEAAAHPTMKGLAGGGVPSVRAPKPRLITAEDVDQALAGAGVVADLVEACGDDEEDEEAQRETCGVIAAHLNVLAGFTGTADGAK